MERLSLVALISTPLFPSSFKKLKTNSKKWDLLILNSPNMTHLVGDWTLRAFPALDLSRLVCSAVSSLVEYASSLPWPRL